MCPINTHLDTSGHCVADGTPLPPTVTVAPTRKADDNVVCEGGTVSNGLCLCPAGFNVMPTSANANGGTCVRTNAENCQGGEMTVNGTCLCNGQVVMSGETYLLEHINGKCVPKHCPVETQWHDGKCVALSAVSPSSEPEPKSKPSAKETPKESSDEDEHRHCGRGMVRTRSGCVAIHHKLPGIYSGAPPGLLAAPAPPNLTKYYRNYQNQTSKMPPPN